MEEPIIPDHDIIIMSDEAHRSQYGVFADNMMGLLPMAARIGFTGTPLLSKILDAIEAADLDAEQAERLEHEFEKEIHLLTAEGLY